MTAAFPAEPLLASGAVADGPRLLAEIGPTHAALALETAPGRLEHTALLDCDNFSGIGDLVRAYLAGFPGLDITHAALALANPVDGDLIRLTHRDWQCSSEALRLELGLTTLLVVNDFTALAMALPSLGPQALRQIGGGERRAQAAAGVIGPDDGLGMSGVVPMADGLVALGSEGGHAPFAPADAREAAVLEHAWRTYPQVSYERLLSLPGMVLLERALAALDGIGAPARTPQQIVDAALAGNDAHCRQVLDMFGAILGSAAASLALGLGAQGGIFIDASRVPQMARWLPETPFRTRFEAFGPRPGYLESIPTYVIKARHPVLDGAAVILAAHLRQRERGPGLLERLAQRQATLAPAERRVAALILAQPRRILSEPIAGIAQLAQVSQPTVIRFCRSLGFQGLADFKLRLSGSLGGSIAVRHSQVGHDDSAHDLSAKVIDNTVATLVALREQFDAVALERAMEIVRAARRVDLFAAEGVRAVALDGQRRLLQLHIPAAVHGDAALLTLAAATLGEGDVAIVLEQREPVQALVDAAACAAAQGAQVIAIGLGRSSLAQHATVYFGIQEGHLYAAGAPGLVRLQHALLLEMVALGLAQEREPRV